MEIRTRFGSWMACWERYGYFDVLGYNSMIYTGFPLKEPCEEGPSCAAQSMLKGFGTV
jgi:hypothetical protein